MPRSVWIVLVVAAVAFFAGLDRAAISDADEAYYVGFRVGEQELGLDQHGHKDGAVGYWEVDDIEQTVEHSHSMLRPGSGAAFSVEIDDEERLVIVYEIERGARTQDADEIIDAIRGAVAQQHELHVHAVVLIQAGSIPGEAAILVRYMGQVTVCRITIPRPGVKVVRPPENNFIDRHVWDKLTRLGIPPSDLADDASRAHRTRDAQ